MRAFWRVQRSPLPSSQTSLLSASYILSLLCYPFHPFACFADLMVQQFSIRGSFTLQGHLVTSGDSCGCHTGEWAATSILWVEARDATKHPKMHRTDPTTKNYQAPNVPNAKAEESSGTAECPRLRSKLLHSKRPSLTIHPFLSLSPPIVFS